MQCNSDSIRVAYAANSSWVDSVAWRKGNDYDELVWTMAPNAPVSDAVDLQLVMVVDIHSHDCWLDSRRLWRRGPILRTCSAANDIVISCTAGEPGSEDWMADFISALQNLHVVANLDASSGRRFNNQPEDTLKFTYVPLPVRLHSHVTSTTYFILISDSLLL